MKQGMILKSTVESGDLEKINCYTRRDLQEEEVYLFNVILCDNEVDRDWEGFTTSALEKLADLFLGKTGIFDHNPKGENQTARIFDTEVIYDPKKKTKYGERYAYLKGRAYMVRSEKNRDLILEIDAGIKKEVSVGCSVGGNHCSICGADWQQENCEHRKGARYNQQLCYGVLDQPTDAYEWSFVAVPSQRNAGVIKSFEITESKDRGLEELKKKLGKGEFRLTVKESLTLKKEWEQLEQRARLGEEYLNSLRARVVRLGFLSGSDLDAEIFTSVVNKMSLEELKAYELHYERKLTPEMEETRLGGLHGGKIAETENYRFKI